MWEFVVSLEVQIVCWQLFIPGEWSHATLCPVYRICFSPEPKPEWKHNGVAIAEDDNRFTFEAYGKTLVFNVSFETAGQYQCIFPNHLDLDRKFDVVVEGFFILTMTFYCCRHLDIFRVCLKKVKCIVLDEYGKEEMSRRFLRSISQCVVGMNFR